MRTATRSASRLTALAFSAMPRPSVLVIDAHPAHLPGYQAVLTQLGIECVCASSTQSAFEFLVHQPCIGIVIDHGVDVSNPIETARRVRRTPGLEHTPIVFVITKHMTDVDALGTAELGSVDYMLLPIVPEILRSKVALFHELHRQRLEIAQLSDRLDAIFPGGENSIISSGADVTTRNRDAEHELQALLDELHAEREWL